MKIEIQDLHKSYRDADRQLTVIQELNGAFASGGSLAIVGRSGVGKSTLLHLLGGLDRPTRGRILYDDHDLCEMKGDKLSDFRGAHIGFIFQFHHLLPEFDALENVSMPLLIGGMPEAQARRKSREILERMGLGDRVFHRPGELSGGEQQRVAIARAMVPEPEVILADEPTGNLDAVTGREIQNLLVELNRSRKNTLVVATHNKELAECLDLTLEMLPGGNLKSLEQGSR